MTSKILITEGLWDPKDESMKSLAEMAELRVLRKDYVAVGVTSIPTEDEILKEIKDADAIITRWAQISPAVLRKAMKLKGIIVHGWRYDNVDLKAATRKRVYISFIEAGKMNDVAEFAFALILASSKRLLIADKLLRKGDYHNARHRLLPPELKGKTLGIIGLGYYGAKVATYGRAFGMKVVAYSPHVRRSRAQRIGVQLTVLKTLLRTADIVSIHCALTPPFESHPNYHLIGEEELNQMKETAIIVNTARGAIIDEIALIRALREKRIAGAALDVFDPDPPRRNNPLFDLENVIVTPHMAGMTYESIEKLGMKVAEETTSILKGKPPRNLINPDVVKLLHQESF